MQLIQANGVLALGCAASGQGNGRAERGPTLGIQHPGHQLDALGGDKTTAMQDVKILFEPGQMRSHRACDRGFIQ